MEAVEQTTIFKTDAGQIFREALNDLKHNKRKRLPIHIVARACVVSSQADKLISIAMNEKYDSDSSEALKKEMEQNAISVIAETIRFIESLRK